MEKTIKRAMEYIKKFFCEDYSGHDYFHSLRVYNTAKTIAEKEGAGVQIVSLAALLHDVDDIKLSPQTHQNKDNAVKFLRENGIDENTIQKITTAISEVSFKGSDTKVPSTIEGMCVQDADRLDAIGAIGIARTFAFGGSHNRQIYNPDEAPALNMRGEQYHSHESHTINHFYEKLFLLKDMMNTQYGKEMAQTRNSFMHEFVDRFYSEWNGEK